VNQEKLMEHDPDPSGRRAALRAGAALLGAAAVSADVVAQTQAAKPAATAASTPVGLRDPRGGISEASVSKAAAALARPGVEDGAPP
jgi:hypothetical protein